LLYPFVHKEMMQSVSYIEKLHKIVNERIYIIACAAVYSRHSRKKYL